MDHTAPDTKFEAFKQELESKLRLFIDLFIYSINNVKNQDKIPDEFLQRIAKLFPNLPHEATLSSNAARELISKDLKKNHFLDLEGIWVNCSEITKYSSDLAIINEWLKRNIPDEGISSLSMSDRKLISIYSDQASTMKQIINRLMKSIESFYDFALIKITNLAEEDLENFY